ncbi:MAG TPA: hypothetical protein VHD55_00675 [Candidatus Paceibacterota bacterium]|nr:hypothetical protein [Candidatus Paceibacterota bacterium]
MARVQLPVSKLKARKRRRRVLALVFALAGALALAAGAIALTWAPFLRIQKLEVAGVSSVNKELVEEQIRKSLSGAYWGVFPRDNIFLYSKAEMRARLLSQFPVFASASLSSEGFDGLRVDLVERKPAALWCGEGPELSGSCLTLDESGAAYTLAADFSGSVYARYTGALPQGPLPRQFLAPEQFRGLAAFVSELSGKLSSTSISVVAVGGDGDVQVVCENGFRLVFSLDDNGADVLERFALALTAGPFATHKLSDFEYLDLRFGDKLYYKLKGEEKAEE